MNPRPANVVRLRQSTVALILAIQFVVMALLVAGYSDLRSAHAFDKRRPYDVCVGSNAQIKKYIDQLTLDMAVPPTATPVERATIEVRNERLKDNRSGLEKIYQDNLKECGNLLSSDR